jgi:hypothetical protein
MMLDVSGGWNKDVTLENFVLWLERQPPRQRYKWEDPENCAVTQWLNDLGYEDVCVMVHSAFIDGEEVLLSDEVLAANWLAVRARSFGGLHGRVQRYVTARNERRRDEAYREREERDVNAWRKGK